MKISVSRVPDEGLREQATYDPTALDMARFDIRLDQACTVDVVITKADQELVVNTAIHCPLRPTCARCLEEFASSVETRAVFTYHVQPTDVVDITDDIRQEVILGYPMIPVCRPDCKGLCLVCGQNLNAGACQHHTS